MHTNNIISSGIPLERASKAIIMLHGRGANASDILELADHLNVPDYALLAPQATNNSWYPYSFLAKPEENEPWLSSALGHIKNLVDEVKASGISSENIYFAGFSQGACLALEFVARNADQYGGVVAFTGGLIGDRLYPENYSGDFKSTPIFIGTGNPDSHVPLERVEQSVALLEMMGAKVTMEVYNGRPHTISQAEIDWANKLIFN